MLVRLPSLLGQFLGPWIVRPVLPERDQRPSVEPKGAPIIFVLREELFQSLDIAPLEKASGKDIPDPLVVVGVQRQHGLIVAERGIEIAGRTQRGRKPGPGAHVRPGLVEAPEVLSEFLEPFGTERQLARLDSLPIQIERLLCGSGFLLREQNIGVSA